MYVLKFKSLGLKSMYVLREVFSPKMRSSMLTEKYLFTVENKTLCNIKDNLSVSLCWQTIF